MGGACIVLQPLIFVVLTAVWFAVRKLSGKASLASLMLTFGFPLGVFLLGGPGWEIATTGALGGLVLLRHTDNIKRLLTGAELSASRDERMHPSSVGHRCNCCSRCRFAPSPPPIG